ncbi:2-hydroxymuconate tautomerase [Chloroflexota bacterium]
MCQSQYLRLQRRISMPIVTVEAIEGRSIEQKRGLVRDITEAVVRNFGAAPELVHVMIHENSRENVAKAGKLKCDG